MPYRSRYAGEESIEHVTAATNGAGPDGVSPAAGPDVQEDHIEQGHLPDRGKCCISLICDTVNNSSSSESILCTADSMHHSGSGQAMLTT